MILYVLDLGRPASLPPRRHGTGRTFDARKRISATRPATNYDLKHFRNLRVVGRMQDGEEDLDDLETLGTATLEQCAKCTGLDTLTVSR